MTVKTPKDVLKEIQDAVEKLHEMEDDYCDCDERCPKCGRKKRPWPGPYYPPSRPWRPIPSADDWVDPPLRWHTIC